MNAVTLLIGKYLNFDVAGVDNGPFKNQLAVAERVLCFGAGGVEVGFNLAEIFHQSHAAAAPSGRSLNHQRCADLRGVSGQCGDVLLGTIVAGHGGNTGFFHRQFGLSL